MGEGGEERQRHEGEQDACCRPEFAGGHGVSFRVAELFDGSEENGVIVAAAADDFAD